MPNLKPTELIILLVVLVLLFGAKKLPDAARGIGRSLRIFKAEVKAQDEIVVEDDKNTETKP
jgi:sec-independent protein translocase protein TatA